MSPHRTRIAALILVTVAAAGFAPPCLADPFVKLKGEGSVTFDDGSAVLRVEGTATELGRFICYGEITFAPGTGPGSLDGEGVVAFAAADGDVLVGVIDWHIDADGTGQAAFHWRDTVTFGDGTTAASTGRFADRRPPGAQVTSIINEGAVATFR
jgi:hypothetical protein